HGPQRLARLPGGDRPLRHHARGDPRRCAAPPRAGRLAGVPAAGPPGRADPLDRPARRRLVRRLAIAAAAAALAAGAPGARAEPQAIPPAPADPSAAAEPAAAPAQAEERAPAATAAAAAARPCARLEERAVLHLRAGQWLDAHVLAEVAQALCDGLHRQRAEVHDALALARLGELERARSLLAGLQEGPDPLLRRTARALESWTLLEMDREAFRASLARLEPAPRLRLHVLADLEDGRDASAAVRRLGPGLR